jgi:hypothetical protein
LWCSVEGGDKDITYYRRATIAEVAKAKTDGDYAGCGTDAARRAAISSDDFLRLKDRGNQNFWEGGCELIHGRWDQETKSYTGVYECGAESSMSFYRFTYSYSSFGGLKVKTEGSIQDPVDSQDLPQE